MKVLFLSAWYPTERDAMAGLFVKKHADAVAQQGHDVRVLYSEKTSIRWVVDMYNSWKRLQQEWGNPDIVQMNVLDKNGLLALWLKRRYHIPFIVIEHWSGYLPANFAFRGGWHGWIMRKIAQNASCILPVSQMLEDAMKNCGIQNENWQRVHNVVDDFFYQPITTITIPKKNNKFRFLHVSCFDEKAKNIQGMLRAVRLVAQQRQNFELICVGTGIDYAEDLAFAQVLDFPKDLLVFTGEQTPYEVAQWMQQSDCFLFFSRYENAPVVLSECLATGLPIISSNAGGIPEMISQECGILVPSEDENSLANAMLEMIDNHSRYTAYTIRQRGTKYTYQNIGKQLSDLYQRVVISTNQRR